MLSVLFSGETNVNRRDGKNKSLDHVLRMTLGHGFSSPTKSEYNHFYVFIGNSLADENTFGICERSEVRTHKSRGGYRKGECKLPLTLIFMPRTFRSASALR